ncbi:MAG TPA: S8 family serine peptidase [Gemmatimonadaceae bacterium]|nr:S8 family serine peptidase [Gemmatimonadaceae bacterium]
MSRSAGLRLRLACLALGCVAACTEATVTGTSHARSTTPLPAAARYIVELGGPGAPSPALTAAIHKAGGQIVRVQTSFGLALVKGLSPAAASALVSTGGARVVIPDVVFKLRPASRPRLVKLAVGRNVHAAAGPGSAAAVSLQWNMHVTHADSAWAHTGQGAGMHVYVLDSGIDTAHVELAGKIDLTNSTSFAYAPTDTFEQNPLPFSHDVVGHGTFVSSIVTTNSVVIAGTAPQATITMVRILDDSGSGSLFGLLNALVYAADLNADVINLSIGGYFNRTSSLDMDSATLLELVVQYCVSRGSLIVAAAGNESLNFNTATTPTASYVDSLEWPGGTPHVLSVGATGPIHLATFQDYDSIAVYSNYGSAGVGVFAPGGNIGPDSTPDASLDSIWVIGACSSATADCPGQENQYLVGIGTSFASPLVAGEAAVIKAQAGTLTPSAVEQCILKNADNITGKRPDPAYNFGRVNVLKSATASGCS